MQNYELLYVIPAQYADSELPALQKKVAGILEKAGVTISRHEYAGKLKLAYPMKGNRYGHYVVAEFASEPAALAKITADLRLTGELIRVGIVKAEAGVRAGGPRTLVSHEEAGMRAREAAHTVLHSSAPVASPLPAPSKPALTTEQIEQKIEEILNEQVV